MIDFVVTLFLSTSFFDPCTSSRLPTNKSNHTDYDNEMIEGDLLRINSTNILGEQIWFQRGICYNFWAKLEMQSLYRTFLRNKFSYYRRYIYRERNSKYLRSAFRLNSSSWPTCNDSSFRSVLLAGDNLATSAFMSCSRAFRKVPRLCLFEHGFVNTRVKFNFTSLTLVGREIKCSTAAQYRLTRVGLPLWQKMRSGSCSRCLRRDADTELESAPL